MSWTADNTTFIAEPDHFKLHTTLQITLIIADISSHMEPERVRLFFRSSAQNRHQQNESQYKNWSDISKYDSSDII